MELAVFRLFTMWGVFPSLPQKQTASYKYGLSHCVSSFSHIFTALWSQSGFTANLYTLVLLFWTQSFIVALWGYPSPEICIYQHPLSSSSQSPAHSHCFRHPFNLVYLFPLVSNRWYLFHFPCCLWVIFERRNWECDPFMFKPEVFASTSESYCIMMETVRGLTAKETDAGVPPCTLSLGQLPLSYSSTPPPTIGVSQLQPQCSSPLQALHPPWILCLQIPILESPGLSSIWRPATHCLSEWLWGWFSSLGGEAASLPAQDPLSPAEREAPRDPQRHHDGSANQNPPR